MNQSTEDDRQRYWENFYASSTADNLACPSQFAAFTAQEANTSDLILELGCGSGRDSIFFARQGFRVVALDASSSAIGHCQKLAGSLGLNSIRFVHSSLGEPGFENVLASALPTERNFDTFIYARFFLHAIDDKEEDIFLHLCRKYMRKGDAVALEYRTVKDLSLSKTTPTHFRRFIDPQAFFRKASRLGLVARYAVEGFGFAKFRQDDAYVARCILEKEN